MSRIGGKSTNDCVYRIMPFLVAHELAPKITRTGKGKIRDEPKFAFDSLTLLKSAIAGEFGASFAILRDIHTEVLLKRKKYGGFQKPQRYFC